jgi:hypothetical protein
MITITHGFEEVFIELNEEKSSNLLSLIKKYKDNLGIGTNIENLIVNSTANLQLVNLNSDVIDNTQYIVNIKHDGKG